MGHIYIFSGLGVDERVFKYINFSGFENTFIKWIKPDLNESMENYAKKLTTQISDSNPILIGLSFGGMMAMEVAKYLNPEKIILIASAKIYTEIPYYYRWAGYLKLHKVLPVKLLKKHTFISDWLFGIDKKEDKHLLAEILKDIDGSFLVWAIDKIVLWKNKTVHNNLIQIHGDNDRILPLRHKNSNFIIKDGGHFMTVNKAHELTEILRNCLTK